MVSNSSAARSSARSRVGDAQELPDYCARPSCRREFIRVVGPGRPQSYCSELCRRAAERELRQTRSKLAHFEALVAQLRVDLAAFGPTSSTDSDEDVLTFETRRAAEDAVTRVAGVVAFLGDSDDPCARELRALHGAVSPVILANRSV